jgi:fructose-1,6-bisphosphatase/inositol monophosphatase family enzyme
MALLVQDETIPRVSEDELRDTVADVLEAGRELVAAQRGVAWSLKPDGSFVTDLDRRIEDQLRVRLEARFPGCDFIGEETWSPSAPAPASRPRLILDPIDGTAAYARGLNFFAISLALVDASGAPRLAILHLPAMGRWFAATFAGGGATRYGVEESPAGPVVRVLDPASRSAPPPRSRDAYVWLGSDPHQSVDLTRWDGKVRALGATAAHLALLLDDTIDPLAAIVTRYKIWDVAAGLALAHAAGFETRDLRAPETAVTLAGLLSGAPLPPFVTARPAVLAQLLPAIALRAARE